MSYVVNSDQLHDSLIKTITLYLEFQKQLHPLKQFKRAMQEQ